jgi:hypothetical protein
LNATGVREVVENGRNGFLLSARAKPAEFAAHLARLAASPAQRRRFSSGAQATAKLFSRERCADLALKFYGEVRRATRPRRRSHEKNPWESYLQRLGVEWDLLASKAEVLASAVFSEKQSKAS